MLQTLKFRLRSPRRAYAPMACPADPSGLGNDITLPSFHSLWGEFCLIPNPVTIDGWGFWEIVTEDGVKFIAVPVHLYAASPDSSKIAHEKRDQIWPCIDRAYHIPKNVCDYDRGKVLLASKAVILACDGAYWHDKREWGVGVFSVTSGTGWSFGGSLTRQFRLSYQVGLAYTSSTTIEGLALYIAMLTGVETGKRNRASSEMAGEESWASMGDHLIIVSDYVSSLDSVIAWAKDGEFFEKITNETWGLYPNEVLVQNLVIAISHGVAVFERITIMHRSELPSSYAWQQSVWPPHTLAHSSRGDSTSVDLQKPWKSDQPFVIKNIKKEGSQLKSITFSYPWWYRDVKFT